MFRRVLVAHFGWILVGFLLRSVCGESVSPLEMNPSARIVGGFSANPGQFPYQVALLRARQISCGGSLIAEKRREPGTVNIGQGGLIRGVQRIIPHERYTKSRNDIALLKLLQPYPLGGLIQTIALASSPNVPPSSPFGTSRDVIISGWGRLSANGPLPSILQYNRATALTPFRCFRQTGFNHGLLCLQSPANNGACFGDSGGPAVYNQQLVGVANFIIGACGSRAPDGYVRVSDYTLWIQGTISQNGN